MVTSSLRTGSIRRFRRYLRIFSIGSAGLILLGSTIGMLGSLALPAVPAWASSSVTLYASPGGTATSGCITSGTTSSTCNLANAISVADGEPSSDAVTIYLEHSSGSTCSTSSTCTFTGDQTVSSSAAAYRITIEPSGSGIPASAVILNGGNSSSNQGTTFTNNAPSGVTVRLDDLTVEGGYSNDFSAGYGGGIYNNGGNLTVTGSTISGNTAGLVGGGIYNNGGNLPVIDSTVSNNNTYCSGPGGGGGIYNDGAMTVTGSTISNNTACTGGGTGGGIYSISVPMDVTDSTISSNHAYLGAGISNNNVITVIDSTISGNTATGGGGGIYNDGGGYTYVTDSAVSGNNAGSSNDGGGIYNNSSSNTTVTNSTISGNTATGGGGGIYNLGTVTLAGSIVAYQTTGIDNCAGSSTPITDAGYNISNGTSCGFSSTNHSEDSATLNLGSLANNGGQTETVALLPANDQAISFIPATASLTLPYPYGPGGSPVTVNLCAGSYGSSANLSLDQRGAPRLPAGATSCDAGSYNYDTTYYAAPTPSYPPTCTAALPCSLAAAISYAGGTPSAVTSVFLEHSSGSTCSTSSTCTFTGGQTVSSSATASSTTIEPSGSGIPASAVILNGGNSSSNQGTTFTNNAPSGVTVTLDDLTVEGGYTSGDGGGIFNGGTMTVTNSTVSGNTAGKGGGIFNNGTTMTVTGSIISGNTASSYAGGGIYNNGSMTVTNSAISGNSAPSAAGGGIYNTGATMTVTNSTINNNSANSGSGGGIFNIGNTMYVADSTISVNTASSGDGGGIDNESTITVTDSTVSGNTVTGSSGFGGGIYNEDIITVTDSTVSDNAANSGNVGGIYNNSGITTLAGSIVADQASGGNCYFNTSSTIADAGYNLSNDTSCGFSASTSKVVSSSSLDLATSLGFNGGTTETIAITSSASTAAAWITSPATVSLPNLSGLGTVTVDLCGGSSTASENSYGSAGLNVDQRDIARPTSGCSAGSYQAPPMVSSISPTTGSTSGGTSVAITGTGFTSGATVMFGGVAAGTVIVDSSTSITAISPAESAGTVNITVTTPGGTSATSSSDGFTYQAPTPPSPPPAPAVSSISPTSGPTSGGTTVTITGENLSGAGYVDFGSVEATSFTVDSSTEITAVSPAESAGIVDITVVTPGGTSPVSTSDEFTYAATPPPPSSPSVASISPTSGSTSGGTAVTITGTGFASGATVKFGSVAATAVTFSSSTSITATSPAESAGTVVVTVSVNGLTSSTTGSTANEFTYVTPPAQITGDAYTPVNPARLADTRCTQSPQPSYCLSENLPAANSTITTLDGGKSGNVTVTGVDSIPISATAVVINVTAVNMTGGGYLSIYPEGSTPAVVSSLNWGTQSSMATNLVTVPVNTTNGEITVTNGSSGPVNLIIDIEGYYAPPGNTPAGLYNAVAPTRIADSRCSESSPPPFCSSENLPAANSSLVALGAGKSENITVTGVGNIPSSGVSAVVLNLTAIDPSAAGYFTAYPAGAARATVSTVNFVPQTVANRVIVKVGTGGQITIYNNSGTANFAVDVSGYYTDGSASSQTGSLFNPVTPARILDTRCSQSSQPNYCSSENLPAANSGIGPIGPGPGQPITVLVATIDNILLNATAFVGNVTAIGGTTGGYLTVYPGNPASMPPTTSDVNFTSGATAANMVIVQLSGGMVNIVNGGGQGSVNVLVDVSGWFTPTTS